MANDGIDHNEDELVANLTEIQLPLLLYVRSLMPGDPAAKDVVQQTNALIWQKRQEYELGTNFKAWAMAIARFEVLNYRKQQARDARLVFSEELENTIASEMTTVSDGLDQRHVALQNCLGKLRPVDRELVLYRYTRTGTLNDYAEEAGRSVAGLKVTLHRVRNSLIQCINRQLQGQEVSP